MKFGWDFAQAWGSGGICSWKQIPKLGVGISKVIWRKEGRFSFLGGGGPGGLETTM